MGYLFAAEGLADLSITAIDSTLIKAKGSIWHKSSMKKGIVPALALIQMQGGAIVIPKDGYLDINYILHVQQARLVVPLTADVTTANVQDNQMYVPLTSSSSSGILFTISILHDS